MATGKKLYFLKLKESFLMGDEIDFLMSQKNGSDYAMMYLILCMKTINTDGKLIRRVGEILVPVDLEKLQRDLKYFSKKTIKTALELYKKFGLIEENDEVLSIKNYEEIVGRETDFADQKRKQRTKNSGVSDKDKVITPIKSPLDSVDNVHTDVHENVHTDIRYIDIEIDKKKESKKKESAKRFTPPTLEELEAYKSEARLSVDCKNFLDYYESNGWMVGKNHMKDWKATMRRWSNTQKESARSGTPNRFQNFEQRSEDLDKYMVRNIGRLV